MFYSHKIKKAINFAVQTHQVDRDQRRKGKNTPYISHPLTVGLILSQVGCDEDTIVAGILHDTIEDSSPERKVTREMIEQEFGKEAAQMVANVTETDKDLPWEVRKTIAREHIKSFDQNSLYVKAADLISNVSEIVDDYERDGDVIFERFKASKEILIQSYLRTITAIRKAYPDIMLAADLSRVASELQSICVLAFMLEYPAPIIAHADFSEDMKVDCPVCGWEGTARSTGSINTDSHRFLDVSCPICDKMVLVVDYPLVKNGCRTNPTRCAIFEKPEILDGLRKDLFEVIDTYVDESHLMRHLFKCRECGQLYFHEFYEEIDWEGGNDPQYSTYIPVSTDDEIERMKNSTPLELLQFHPRLQKDFPKDAKEPTPWHWLGKEREGIE